SDRSEDLSTGLFDQIVALLTQLKGSVDTAESTSSTGLSLDTPIPLLGKSLKDILGTGDILQKVIDALSNKGEGDGSASGGSACTGNTDDDGDGYVNDGCPSVGPAGQTPPAPEAGAD